MASPEQDPRAADAPSRGERETLVGYLEAYRTTLELKCDGLTPEQLGTRSVPPSSLSLIGLVRHLARVEHHWFRRMIEGRTELSRLHAGDEADAGFSWPGEADQALVADAWSQWRSEIAHARDVLDHADLDALVEVDGIPTEVRDIVVHMIEEYARHCGHADLVRECIDGRAGQ
ncbi:DinB family protein [Nocardioides alcanivorans]|uniref:DinB family protein n=1 Tax=Nocardioides alcanivorans TaxID=2897352 RepID=UPI001F25F823|nr:DinB family protein [Nocardioides alcanivorans]